MKAKYKLILTALLLFITPSFVYAASINIDCPSKVNQGSQFTCTIGGNFNKNVNRILVKYSYNSKITYSNLELLDNWTLSSDESNNNKSFIIENSSDKTGNIQFSKITFNIANNTQGQNLDLQFYGFDATNSSAELIDFNPSIVNKSIHVNSTNNSLKRILIEGNEITLVDSSVVYEFISNKKNITIIGELDSSVATCENLSRNVELNEGENTIIYTVYAEDGTPNTYTFKIIYEEISNTTNPDNNIDNDQSNDSNISNDNNESNTSGLNKYIPFTGDNIIFYFSILFICVIILTSVYLALKKKKNK